MKKEIQIDRKSLIIIVVLILLLLVNFIIIVPRIQNRTDKAVTELAKTKELHKELEFQKEMKMLKLGEQTNKERIKSEKEQENKIKLETIEQIEEAKYLESSNKNIFYLFSSIAKILHVDVSELDIKDLEDVVRDESISDSDLLKYKEEEPDGEESNEVELDEELGVISGEESGVDGLIHQVPIGYKVDTSKHVSLSMYGNYIDIMLYFQMLDRLSDNFELVSLDITPLVLADGFPVEDYTLAPNEYNFISGDTLKSLTKLDIFYYESKLKEKEMQEIKEKEKEKEDSMSKSLELRNKRELLTQRYTASKSDVTNLARYYSEKHGVPVPYILAVVDQESGFQAGYSSTNSNGVKERGLMQLKTTVTQQLLKVLGLDYVEGIEHIPSLNIELGTMYLSNIAKSRGINFLSPEEVDLHYLMSAYKLGITEVESYSKSNKTYSITPYETAYSQAVLSKVLDYTIYDDVGEVKAYSHTSEVVDFLGALALIEDTPPESREDKENVINNYMEVTSVKAVFKVKNAKLGSNTLLKHQEGFNFNEVNTKVSPLSIGNLQGFDVSYIGNKGELLYDEKKLKNHEYRESELRRTKEVIRNRIIKGLEIEKQLEYLRKLTVHTM